MNTEGGDVTKWVGTLSGLEKHKGSLPELVAEANYAEDTIPVNVKKMQEIQGNIQDLENDIARASTTGLSEVDIQVKNVALAEARKEVERLQQQIDASLEYTPGDSDESVTYH